MRTRTHNLPTSPILLAIATFCLVSLASSRAEDAATKPTSASASWTLGISGWGFHRFTLYEAIEKVKALGLRDYDAISFQKVSATINHPFNANLPEATLDEIITHLQETGVRIPVLYYANFPTDEAACRKVFEFGRKVGVRTFISEPPPELLDQLETLCDTYNINLALHNHGPDQTPHYWSPEKVLAHCKGRGPRIGVCPDTGYWMREGIDPVEGIRKLGSRILTVQLHDLHERSSTGHDVPWGQGTGEVAKVLKLLDELNVHPTLIGLEYSHDFEDNLQAMTASIRFYRDTVSTLTRKP